MDRFDVRRPSQEQLAAVPLLATLTDDHLGELARRIEIKQYKPGDVIVREGTDGYEFYFVFEGTVEVRHRDTAIRTLGPGDYFGEIGMLENSRRTADVCATSAVEVGYLFGTSFRELQISHPEITQVLGATAASRRD